MEKKLIVHAIVKNSAGKYLIIKRSKNNDVLPEMWDIPGGKVEEGESLDEALAREVSEETGAQVLSSNVFNMVENVDQKKNMHFIKLIFIATSENLDSITLNPDEHDTYAWISLDELDGYQLVDYVKECFLLIKNRVHLLFRA